VIPTPFTLADTVLAPATVELSAPVATPLEFVVADGCVSVLPLPVAARTTVAPAIGFPAASLAVAVTVEVLPFAAIVAGDAVRALCAAETAPAVTPNATLVVARDPGPLAVRMYPVPALSMVRLSKVATPLTTDLLRVPPRTAPAVPVPLAIAIAMVPEALVTVFDDASCTDTCTDGAITVPDTTALGCAVNASWLGAPGASVTAVEVAPASPAALKLRVRAPIVPAIIRSVKLAAPLPLVVEMRVPPSVPPPLAMAAVTTAPAWATVLPVASRNCTTGCCVRTAPLTAVAAGWVVTVS
jgi:hypothetical protein